MHFFALIRVNHSLQFMQSMRQANQKANALVRILGNCNGSCNINEMVTYPAAAMRRRSFTYTRDVHSPHSTVSHPVCLITRDTTRNWSLPANSWDLQVVAPLSIEHIYIHWVCNCAWTCEVESTNTESTSIIPSVRSTKMATAVTKFSLS